MLINAFVGTMLLMGSQGNAPAPQRVGDFEATVAAVEVPGKEWKQDAFTTFRAKKGEEILLVRISLKARATEAKLKSFRLISEEGSEHKSVTLEFTHHGGAPGAIPAPDEPESFELTLPFGVPIGTRAKTLLIDGVAFDLTEVPVTKPSPRS